MKYPVYRMCWEKKDGEQYLAMPHPTREAAMRRAMGARPTLWPKPRFLVKVTLKADAKA